MIFSFFLLSILREVVYLRASSTFESGMSVTLLFCSNNTSYWFILEGDWAFTSIVQDWAFTSIVHDVLAGMV